MTEIFSLLGSLALLFVTLSAARLGRLGTNGLLFKVAELLLIPAFILSLWMLWSHIGWFTIGALFVQGFIVGAAHAVIARHGGNLHLLVLQPFIACVFLSLLLACSVLAFI